MQVNYLKNRRLPDKPGVYFFKNKKNILYIGKATSLKDRVKSYFGKDLIETRGALIVDMVFKADAIDWQETESVLEALILEAALIKKHQPYYNTKEKDNKSFNVVCITKEAFPKVLVLRERILKNNSLEESDVKFQAKYGPFTSGSQLKEAMKIIRPIFPYLDVKSSQPDHLEFYRQIGLAPDVGTQAAQMMYEKNIHNLKLFFQGKKKRVISNFKKEMNMFAKNKEFENAHEMKKRIFALTHINDVALLKNENLQMQTGSVFRIEAYDIAHMSGENMVGVMTVVEDGEAEKSEYKKFKIRTQKGANDVGALVEVLGRRFTHTEWKYPDLVVVDGGVAQFNAACGILLKMGINIAVVAVVKDEKHNPKDVLGNSGLVGKHKKSILLSNSEAHRFAIAYHKKTRNKNFLKS